MATTAQPIIVKSGNNGLLFGGLILGGGIFGYITIIKPMIDEYKSKNSLKRDQASTIKAPPGKVLKDLNGKPTTSANLSTIAADLYEALSFPADGARAVRVFKSTPWGYVEKLEEMYLDKYKENLKDRLVKKLSDEQWISIKFNFR